jgi:hypothetical protein
MSLMYPPAAASPVPSGIHGRDCVRRDVGRHEVHAPHHHLIRSISVARTRLIARLDTWLAATPPMPRRAESISPTAPRPR